MGGSSAAGAASEGAGAESTRSNPPAARPDITRLVADHHAELYRYAFRLCGSAVDAEDLTQQVFLTAQMRLGQVRSAETARSWLFTILRNAYLKHALRRAPIPAASLDLDLNTVPEDLPHDLEIDGEQLQLALNHLPDEFKLVLLMFYFEGCSYRQIAQRLNLPAGTVMSRLSRAKSHLRSVLLELPARTVASAGAAGGRAPRQGIGAGPEN
jgi:RNA polymerase sigma-70 factor (ECF subfamily)